MLVCSPVIFKNRVLGYSCYGYGGKYEFDFESHCAMGMDFKEIPTYFESKIGALIFKFDRMILCKSVLKEGNDELSELTCYPLE